MVALMSEALALTGTERVLEIGTGSGYQTAILSTLCDKVFSVERLKGLADRAVRILDSLDVITFWYGSQTDRSGGGRRHPSTPSWLQLGLPPFLRRSWHNCRSAVAWYSPVGDASAQTLRKGIRESTGMRWQDLGGCVFVKLVGQQGWPAGL